MEDPVPPATTLAEGRCVGCWPISEATAGGCGVCLLRVHPPPEWRGRSSIAATIRGMSAIGVGGVRYPSKFFHGSRKSWRLLLPSRPGEFHPEPLTDSVREPLDSYGSCHRAKAAAFR